jgi:hypothetical protein
VTTGVWGWEPVCGSLGLGISFPWSLHSILYLYPPFLPSLHSVPFGSFRNFFFKALYLPTLLAVVLDDDDDGLLRLTEDYGYI